jgi:hypothetical protein
VFERLLHFLVKRRTYGRIAQRGVQCGTALAGIDNLAFSHRRICSQNALFAGDFQKRIEVGFRHTLPPDVKRQSAGGKSGSRKCVAQKRNGVGSHVFIFCCSSVARIWIAGATSGECSQALSKKRPLQGLENFACTHPNKISANVSRNPDEKRARKRMSPSSPSRQDLSKISGRT